MLCVKGIHIAHAGCFDIVNIACRQDQMRDLGRRGQESIDRGKRMRDIGVMIFPAQELDALANFADH